MNGEIILHITDYISAYDRYASSIGSKPLIEELSGVYNQLLDIAEKNAENYDEYIRTFSEKKIEERFSSAIQKCRREFNRHI